MKAGPREVPGSTAVDYRSEERTQFHVIEAKEYSAKRTSTGRRQRLAEEGPMISPMVPAGRDSYVSTGC
jgi:hypothetical protein